jgi:uncharacterized protein YdhG (YjbR/CyaY superfamily)
MKTAAKIKFKTVDEYLSDLPDDTKSKLQQLRETIKKAAPQAEEVISYNMPAIKGRRVLVYYAAHKEHIGFYPTASPIRAFKKELSAYDSSKGAIKFPIEKPIPLSLVTKIVKYRVKEDPL